LDIVNVADGLKDGGKVVVNSPEKAETLKSKHGWPTVAQVDAQTVALEELGVAITNTTMLGALLKATDILPLSALQEVIDDRFGPKLGPKNYKAFERAYNETVEN